MAIRSEVCSRLAIGSSRMMVWDLATCGCRDWAQIVGAILDGRQTVEIRRDDLMGGFRMVRAEQTRLFEGGGVSASLVDVARPERP